MRLDNLDQEYAIRSSKIEALIKEGADIETILYLFFDQISTIARDRLKDTQMFRQFLAKFGERQVVVVSKDITGGLFYKVTTVAKLGFQGLAAASAMYAGISNEFAWFTGYSKAYEGAANLAGVTEHWTKGSLDASKTLDDYVLQVSKMQQQDTIQDSRASQEEHNKALELARQTQTARREAMRNATS